ncbi:hypothetical protein [Leptothoe sp. PORK10 BA2]|uniref:hypothetical protein n=1 Tax=Leptothoe sp. PORK10 BA2 TaxID=3110254 RepID=UPI002B1F0AD1|nr:hypothetical protein [Leptothoe sp. PORK10 BA2]MEA5464475.1 hypothetical protein [Leptothoe sp. PORK10 BA2]
MTSSSLTKKTAVRPTVGVVVELTAGGDTATLSMERIDQGAIVYRGGMPPGQTLRLGALLEDVFKIEALASMRSLTITELSLEMRPALEAYAFKMGIANAWSLEIETSGTPLRFSVDQVSVSLKKSPQETYFFLRGDFSLGFTGGAQGKFSLSVSRIVTTTPARGEWVLLAKASNLELKPLVDRLLGEGQLTADFGLDQLTIQALELELIQEKIVAQAGTPATTRSLYRFYGAINWGFTIAGEPITVVASADIRNYTESRNATGSLVRTKTGIAGRVAGSIELFEKTVKASIFYEFSQSLAPPPPSTAEKRIGFAIKIKSFGLTGLYSKRTVSGRVFEKIDFGFSGTVNIGDLISYVVSLFDPSLEDFELDAPWDRLGKENIDLTKLTASIDLTNSRFTFSYGLPVDLGLFKITGIGLAYEKVPGSAQYRPNISLNLVIPGLPVTTESWDPVNENPPNIPGQGVQVFDLQFLAVGQRVTFHPDIVARARNITQVMTVLRQTMGVLPPAQRRQNPLAALQARLPSPAPVSIDPTATITLPAGSSPIVFNPNSGILLGAQFSVMETLDMSVIFNDPLIYGLRISLYGAKAKLFAGLQFEILYRRVSDTVGVYHVELAMPEAMRQFDVGALAVTLPVIVVDIYTNGDFAIDFGFPWKGDFTRSFAIQGFAGPFPILGFGGFYFAKLSAETATSTPVISNGTFSPVYEFGLGLKIGLGRTFNKGVLKAEISITIHGVIQGVVARFNPSDPAVASDDYFKIQGGVSLVGRLYGVVDFGVISVDVEVLIRATVLFVVEAYQPTQIVLEAEVSVRASIKVLFVRVRFSFSLTLRQSFTLGSASPTPWKLGAPPATAGARFAPAAFSMPVAFAAEAFAAEALEVEAMGPEMVTPMAFRTLEVATFETADFTAPDETPANLSTSAAADITASRSPWAAVKLPLSEEQSRIDLYFQPGFTRVDQTVAGVGLLFIENSMRSDNPDEFADNASRFDTDFDQLVKALLLWTLHNYGPIDATQPLALADWEALYDRFIAEFETANHIPHFLGQLYLFLAENFVFEICDRITAQSELDGTFFPMVPPLAMTINDAGPINFQASHFTRSLDQIQQIKDYLKALQVRPGSAVESSAPGSSADPTSAGTDRLSLADYLFADYFLLLIRSGLQSAIDYLESRAAAAREANTPVPVESVQNVLDALNRNGAFNHLAGTASRYFLHGLRLPILPDPMTPPVVVSAPETWATQALYVATGQQFNIATTTSTEGTGETAREIITPTLNKIKLSNPTGLPWIQFLDYGEATPPIQPNGTSLTYVLSPSDKTFLQQLPAPGSAPDLPEEIVLLPFYKPAPRQYTLRQRVVVPGGTLWTLPADLRAYIQPDPQAEPLPAAPNIFFSLADAMAQGAPALANAFVAWSTKLKVTVRRLGADNVYQLEGTDEVGKDLLEAVRTQGGTPTLELLYLNSDTAQLESSHADVLLLKTNLSTRSQSSGGIGILSIAAAADIPGTTYRAALPGADEDGTAFLQLLWECSTVNSGGYYLAYGPADGDGLPAALFTDGVAAELVLVIHVANPLQLANQPQQVQPFHNCVQVTTPLSDAQADLLATRVDAQNQVADPVQVLQMPAGHLGVQLTRPAISVDSSNGTAKDELENLYQLLGYRLLANEFFKATPEGLPMGPASDDPTDEKLPWQYERVIPVYGLAVSAAGPPAPLPSPTMNPYRGVGATATLQLEWRDLYGNVFKQFEPPPLPVRYFDPLLGLNQWPALMERYRFTPGAGGTAKLTLSLQLDTSQYSATPGSRFDDVQRKTRAARETYQQVFYQIHQPDVTATVETSVLLAGADPVQTEILDRADPGRTKPQLPDFVDEVYRYLSTLEGLRLLSHLVQSGETFGTIATDFRLQVKDLATENQEKAGLWTVGTPLEILVEKDLSAGDRLQDIALAALRAEALLADLETVGAILSAQTTPDFTPAQITERVYALALYHRHRAGLVQDQLGISIPGKADYTTQPGNTLAEIVAATEYSLTLLAEEEELPASGTFSVVVVNQLEVYHVRIFDGSGNRVVENAVLSNETLIQQLNAVRRQGSEDETLEEQKNKRKLTLQIAASLDQQLPVADVSIIALVDYLESGQPTNGGDYLSPQVTLPVPLAYRYRVNDSLADIRDRVKAALGNETIAIGLDAELLTVADIALATETALTAGISLDIPGHLNLGGQDLPSQATVGAGNAKLADLVTTLNQPWANAPQQQIKLEAVVTTNQTLVGLIQPGVPLQTALESWLTLDGRGVPPGLQAQVQPFLSAVTVNVATRQHETFYSLTQIFEQIRQALVDLVAGAPDPADPLLKAQVQQLRERLSRKVSLAEVAIATQTLPLLQPGASLIVPPYALDVPISFDLTGSNAPVYPQQLIFPVTVQVTLQRSPELVAETLVPEETLEGEREQVQQQLAKAVQQSTAYLSPHTMEDDARSASLAGFAQDFQETFAGLRLATSDNRNPGFPGDPTGPSQSIWAVRLGQGGLTYNIAAAAPPNNPLFFAPKPLANTLMSGLVNLSENESKRFDAIDLNLLGQNFLQAVEDFLAPKVSMPAVRLGATAEVDRILDAKDALADAISAQVVSLLDLPVPPQPADIQAAAEALKQELKINLAAAYAIETIVQYNVSVTNTDHLSDTGDFPVRLAGQPTLIGARDATTKIDIADLSVLDFTLSPSKVSLTQPSTYLTFFFDTQNPDKYEDIELNLTFKSNELEYNIKSVEGIDGYQASDWLSFIVQDDPDPLGHVQIPIPLRTYPIPPSLVLQQAELDPDAVGDDLANVRQWQYVYTYEHLDVAQDSLESDVRYNLVGMPAPAALGIVEDSSAETLFDALVRFNQQYPEIQKIFEQLAEADTAQKIAVVNANGAATTAITNFAESVRQVAEKWAIWQPPVLSNSGATGVDYTINEEDPPVLAGQPTRKEVTIEAPVRVVDPVMLPQVLLPGYRLEESIRQDSSPTVQKQLYQFVEKSPEEAALDPVYGESSIPDRTLIIQDRDILAQQNAWSGIWLTRNRQLVSAAPTNPAFVFQTPQVRFSNWVTPLLVNRRPWNIAALSADPRQTVSAHLQQLFKTVLPDAAPQAYGLRLDCRYAFAVATVADEQLFSTVPVLLTPRIAIAKSTTISDQFVTALSDEIERWRRDNHPVEAPQYQGRYQFTLNLFSGLDVDATLPLLKIEQLYIRQGDINWPTS